MPNKKNKSQLKPYHILVCAGFTLLAFAAVSLVYDMVDDYMAGKRAQNVLAQMEADPTPEDVPAENEEPADEPAPIEEPQLPPAEEAAEEAPAAEEPAPQVAPPPPPSYTITGVLAIPSLKVKLPVLGECTDPLLKISVCRYQGATKPQPQRLVIAGHNYKSHFGRIPKLNIGDEVTFTNKAGEIFYYAVSEITEIAGDDYVGLYRGEWDITMFTCTSDSKRRILVRCLQV